MCVFFLRRVLLAAFYSKSIDTPVSTFCLGARAADHELLVQGKVAPSPSADSALPNLTDMLYLACRFGDGGRS
jgi:hypothetical protein